MSLSSTEQITSTIQFDNNDFSFTKTYGTMIQNVPYAEGFRCFENEEDRRNAFIYKALSAVSDEVGNSLYLNIKRYIDFVSNVDVCKLRSLKSMLYILGFKETIIDKFFSMPKDVLDLLDVLSIQKKILLKSGMLKQDFLNDLLSSENSAPIYKDQDKIDFRRYFGSNAFILSSSPNIVRSSKNNTSKLLNVYTQVDDVQISNFNISNSMVLSSQVSRPDFLSTCNVFVNSYNDFIIDDKEQCSMTLYNGTTFEPILAFFNEQYDQFSDLTHLSDTYVFNISDTYENIQLLQQDPELSNTVLEYDNSFLNSNRQTNLAIQLVNLQFNEDLSCIDEAKYEEYIENIYYDLLYSHITQTYNATFLDNTAEKQVYIYPYLGDLYFDVDYNEYLTLNDYQEQHDSILSTKMFWHIPASFDETKIVDNIEIGADSLDNYQGYQLSVLHLEIQKRKDHVDFDKIGIDAAKNSSKNLQTRYSYYREKDVAEYAKFIDNYYSMLVDNPKIYSFDSNYYELSANKLSSNVISIYDSKNIEPNDDINKEKIHIIAKYLATLTMYICKLREKIKQQTQKNYMKGTNLLLIYVINEYLIEYARNNKQLFLQKNEAGTEYLYPELVKIYAALSSHQFGTASKAGEYTIDIKEYYDTTQYFNIKTNSTISAENSTLANDRYWETGTSNPILNDGQAFNLADIEDFYLNILDMKSTLGDSQQSFANFMSSIYDLGANDSFIFDLDNDKELSVFSSQLDRVKNDDGTPVFASDIYRRLIDLSSSYINFNQWLSNGGYTYPTDTVENQISNVTETYIYQNLSNTYLSDVSAMYDKYISCVNSLSDGVDSLSLSYDNFLDGEYSFYYTKSNNKYSYEDNDIDNGSYRFPYYVGNTEYDNDQMSLYEHLYQLEQYSTVENIQNHVVRYIAEDVLKQFQNIHDALLSDLVSPLTASYGMIDIDSPKLDEELQYTYDYALEKKKERIEFLQTQLANLQSQANDLKSQYDQLENSFAEAIGSYDDDHPDYSLKDNETVYCVSQEEMPTTWTGGQCLRSDNQPKASEKLLFCKEYPEYTYNDKIKSKIKTLVGTSKIYSYVQRTFFYYGLTDCGTIEQTTELLRRLATYIEDGEDSSDDSSSASSTGTTADIWKKIKDTVKHGYDSIEDNIKNVVSKVSDAIDSACGDDDDDDESQTKYAYEAYQYEKYDDDDTLENRCKAFISYMDTPTMMTFISGEGGATSNYISGYSINYIYGFMKEGTYASVNAIQSGIARIKLSFATISNLAEQIFGITLDGTSTDIYDQIIELIEKLIDYDTNLFNYDKYVKIYNELIAEAINLSSDLISMQTEYQSVFSDLDQATYLGNFNYTGDLTQEQIEDLISYCKRTDSANYNTIIDKIKQMIDVDFQNLLDDKTQLERNLNDDGVDISYTTGTYIEKYIDDIYQALLNDIYTRTLKANEIIDSYKNIIIGYLDIIESEILASLSVVNPFDDTVLDKLDELNFFNHSLYQQYENLFLTYGGREFCYDPYYNLQNQTHPSYQIHPFVWNIVEKMNNQTLIETGFKSQLVDMIEESQAIENVRNLIGDYGQTIDTWKNVQNGVVDYSGYYTRYEKSENYCEDTGIFNEVVDYDGAFFPKAVDEFKQLSAICINSVADQMSTTKLLRNIQINQLNNKFLDYLSCDAYGKILSSGIYNRISSYINTYTHGSTVSATLSAYLFQDGLKSSEITMQDIIQAISDGLPGTFFDRYYKHLGLTNSQYEYIAKQLIEYVDDIVDKTTTTYKNKQYDIYKYGLDYDNNSYILFKQYNVDPKKVSFNDKRNTKGQMWIRFNSHPIAFPAFNGEHPQYYKEKYDLMQPAILKLAKLQNNGFILNKDTDYQYIANDMCYFYDFTISQDMQSISYVVHNANLDGNDLGDRYDLAWVIADEIHTYYDNNMDVQFLLFTNKSSDYTAYEYDYIDFNPINGMLYDYRSTKDLRKENDILAGVYHPALIGQIIHNNNAIECIYAFKKYVKSYDSDGNPRYSIEFSGTSNNSDFINIFSIDIIDGVQYQTYDCPILKYYDDSGSYIVGETACVSYDKNLDYATIAFLTKIPDESVNVETTDGTIDIVENANDVSIDDPTAIESTSQDIFSSNVTLFKFKCRYGLKLEKTENYNINADISYIPAYPGEDNQTKLYKNKYSSEDYYCVELLGKSKNFDKAIECVNVSPDPYFDYNKIKNDYIFGRVYEDYDNNIEDKTFCLTTMPALNINLDTTINYNSRNPFNVIDNDAKHEFIATLYVDRLHNYTSADINNLEVLIYNRTALGKNPYYIGKLIDLTSYTEFNYIENEDNYTLEITTTKEDTAAKTTAIGTPVSISTTSKLGSNRFQNINGISAVFDINRNAIEMHFEYDKDNSRYAFIPSDSVAILLYNNKDLTIFEYYHLFDAYGMINCYDGNMAVVRNVENRDGWTIVHAKKGKYADARQYKSFYMFEDVEQYLEDIRLSDYTALSDMYIFAGTSALGFKYDEELKFPLSSELYYYPTLNISYPRTPANYVIANKIFSSNDVTGLSAFNNIFDDNNTFILQLDEPNRIANKIGKINIPILLDASNDLIAYEDYLHIDDEGIANCNKYGIDDSRLFEFLQFESVQGIPTTYTCNNMLSIPDSDWKNMSIDNADANLESIYNCGVINAESYCDNNVAGYKQIEVTSADIDISKFLYLRVNYKVDSETKKISLYFNYNNYLNSPYVKIEDGKTRLDIIDGTYLKLDQGEDGFLDVVVQFRYWNGNDLLGYKNSKILSYRIYNISDDKPKFIIKKSYEIQTNSQLKKENDSNLSIRLTATDVYIDDADKSGYGYLNLDAMVQTTLTLKSGYDLYIDYPGDILAFYPVMTHDYDVSDDSESGLLHIVVNNTLHNQLQFKFKTIDKCSELNFYKSRTYAISMCDTEIYDEDNEKLQPAISNCTFTITSTRKYDVLAATESTETTTTAYAINSINTTVLVG